MYRYGYVCMSQYGIKWKCKSWLGRLKQHSLFSVVFLPKLSSPTDQQGILACRHHPGAATQLAPGELAQVFSQGAALCMHLWRCSLHVHYDQ